MRVKESIFAELEKIWKEEGVGITAAALSERMNMRRNLVSQYLNELVKEKRVVKTVTRPVMFTPLEAENMCLECLETTKSKKEDAFSPFIGAKGSLKQIIEQCRSAVLYPGKGLPILLNGPSGVGKSYLAELIYRYAIESGVIAKDAPFVTLNCADYASNPELLSAMLFGYTKGSFTGAEKTKEGLVHQADQGYLFLDEVHRLSNENQEKLFLLMDRDEYRRIGDSDTLCKAHVRLIFATTEDPQQALIHTLRRRIPMILHIPSLQERPIREKLKFIQKFYWDECLVFGCDISVHAQVINFLLCMRTEGNVGSLQNIIRYSCASAFHTNRNEKIISIDFSTLPRNYKLQQDTIKEYVTKDLDIHVSTSFHFEEEEKVSSFYIDEVLAAFRKNYQKQAREFMNIGNMQKMVYQILETYSYSQKDTLQISLIEVVVGNFEKENGIRLGMNTAKIISCLIEQYQSLNCDDIEKEFDDAIQDLEEYHFKLFLLAKRLIHEIEVFLGISLKKHVQFYIILYIIVTNCDNSAVRCNALIMAHGNSTASSVASAVNELLGEFIFEAFDMPLHTTTDLFSTLLNKYMERVNKRYPTLILVDMGSLMEINRYIEIDDHQELGILDSLSTSLALQAGDLIRKEVPIAELLEQISGQAKVQYHYLPARKRQKVIVCICISGIGTAEKVREIIRNFVRPDYELLTCDYMKLLKEGKKHRIFHDYDVECVVGTSDFYLDDVDYININHLIDGNNEADIALFVKKIVSKDNQINIEELRQKIIKAFSLENLINQLVFLNPKTIIDDVEAMIIDTEVGLHMKFDTDVRMMLFLHIAVLIERALLKNCEDIIYQDKQWITTHQDTLNIISKSFIKIERKFNIQIPEAEIIAILQMIQMKKQI